MSSNTLLPFKNGLFWNWRFLTPEPWGRHAKRERASPYFKIWVGHYFVSRHRNTEDQGRTINTYSKLIYRSTIILSRIEDKAHNPHIDCEDDIHTHTHTLERLDLPTINRETVVVGLRELDAATSPRPFPLSGGNEWRVGSRRVDNTTHGCTVVIRSDGGLLSALESERYIYETWAINYYSECFKLIIMIRRPLFFVVRGSFRRMLRTSVLSSIQSVFLTWDYQWR